MDLTLGTSVQKQARAKKMALLFAMISIFMMFGGLTSAYLVSKSRPDWITDYTIPTAFYISTAVIVLSSLTFHLAQKAIQKGDRSKATTLLITTLFLGIAFIVTQFVGFSQVIAQGYYFTGTQSNITTSFLYALTITHILHILGGIIVLLVVIYNHFKQRYKPGQTLGIELGAMFWHFLDILWVYLFLFLYFVR